MNFLCHYIHIIIIKTFLIPAVSLDVAWLATVVAHHVGLELPYWFWAVASLVSRDSAVKALVIFVSGVSLSEGRLWLFLFIPSSFNTLVSAGHKPISRWELGGW